MKEYFVKIKNVIISIFSYGILFILKTVIMSYSYVDSLKKYLIFMKSLIYTLYYGGEQNYLNKVLSNSNFKTIDHIAIIIQNYNEHNLLKLVSWIRMLKIKYFTIYDPFKAIKSDESENFKIKINNLFKYKVCVIEDINNLTIFNGEEGKNKIVDNCKSDDCMINKNIKIDNHKIVEYNNHEHKHENEHLNDTFKIINSNINEEVNNNVSKNLENISNDKLNISKNSLNFNKESSSLTNNKNLTDSKIDETLNIFIVDYKEANFNYIKDLYILEDFSFLPSKYNSIQELKEAEKTIFKYRSENTGYKKYATIKQSIIFPEIILAQDNLDCLNLYGFPFSMLENCEIL